MTFCDLQDHSDYCKSFQMRFLYSYAAADNVTIQLATRLAVSLR